jgi:hypothetical protein
LSVGADQVGIQKGPSTVGKLPGRLRAARFGPLSVFCNKKLTTVQKPEQGGVSLTALKFIADTLRLIPNGS